MPYNLQVSNYFGYLNAAGNWSGNSSSIIFGNNDNAAFRRFTRQFVFPADMSATRVYVDIGVAAAMVESGSAFVDDIEVYEQDFASDGAHPTGESYFEDQSFEKDGRCGTNVGIVVDPSNARTGYKAVRLTGNYSHASSLSSHAVVGKAYTASFYAKAETASTQLQVSYGYFDADGKFQHKYIRLLPTLLNSYQRYEIRFPIPFNAQKVGNIYFGVYPKTDGQIAWVDDCKVVESPILFQQGNMLKTVANQVAVREQPSSSADNTKVATGCTLPIEGYAEGSTINGSNRWVKVKWCTYNNGAFNLTSRYIHESVAEEVYNANPNYKSENVISIAQSLVGTTGGNLNLKGKWCQTFLYWLCYIANVNLSRIPVQYGVTKDAAKKLSDDGLYTDGIANPSFLPTPGFWIYYKNVESDDEFSHVGLIVRRDGKELTCIEGNLGKETNSTDRKVQKVIIPDCTAETVVVNKVPKIIKGYGRIVYL